MTEFSFKVGNLEVRSCDKNLLQEGEHVTAEIIEWKVCDGKPYCSTVAHWVDSGEKYFDLLFISSRPYEVDKHDLFYLAELGHKNLLREFH